MRKITADLIYTKNSQLVQNMVLLCEEDGLVLDLVPLHEMNPEEVENHNGLLCPGFINAHCHLELSHLKGVVSSGTGLLPFLQKVVKLRSFPQEIIEEAIQENDRYMWDAGIVAVGDISNKEDTFSTKRKSPICYYSFIEMFDFLQEENSDEFTKPYLEVFEKAPESSKNKKSAVPHAPYTVSRNLFEKIKDLNKKSAHTISIHNQECEAENQLFLKKEGDFLDFYKDFNFSIDHFQPTGQSSIRYAISQMDSKDRIIFVHNTMTTEDDVRFAHNWNKQVYWATCPNANLYIENRLPDYQVFLQNNAKVCIGTDSLTSNWQLSVLEEIKTILKYQSYVPLGEVIKWATQNGAEALGFDHEIGTIEKGKTPGINLISLDEEGNLFSGSQVKKLM